MEREMPIRRRSARLSSGGRRRSARLAVAAAPGQYPGSWKLKQQREPSSSLVPSTMKKVMLQRAQSACSGKTQSAASGGNGKHHWSVDEEEAFVNAVVELAPKHHGWDSKFYQAIADTVNTKCSRLREVYVPLNATKVMTKRKECKRFLKSYKRPEQFFCVRNGTIEPRFGTACTMDSSSGGVMGPSTVKDDIITAEGFEKLEQQGRHG